MSSMRSAFVQDQVIDGVEPGGAAVEVVVQRPGGR